MNGKEVKQQNGPGDEKLKTRETQSFGLILPSMQTT